MSIGKVFQNVTAKTASVGKQVCSKAAQKAKPALEQGEVKLANALDSLASSMKAKVAQKQVVTPRIDKITSEIPVKKTAIPAIALEKTAKKADIADFVTGKKITSEIPVKKPAIPTIALEKTAKKADIADFVTGKKANKSAEKSAQTFLEDSANKLADFVTGEKANTKAVSSAVVFELNGKTKTENLLDQQELKGKLLGKYGDKLAQEHKIEATKARLLEKYGK